MKKREFVMIPRNLHRDARLQRWMTMDHINPFALSYALVIMMERLQRESDLTLPVSELLAGLNGNHLPYKVLKEIVETSGFFDCRDGFVKFNWQTYNYAYDRTL